MQLRHLETFVTIVDRKTLTAAATQLYKSQAAVSQDLRRLEEELGVELIDRSGQRVELTQAGSALLPMARRLLRQVDDVASEMSRVRDGESAVVRIACLPSLAPRVAQLIASFSDTQGAIHWSLFGSLRRETLSGLRHGEFDLAICEPNIDDDISNVLLDTEPVRVVISSRHSLARASQVTPGDLVSVPYIGFGSGSTSEAQHFFATGDRYQRPVVEVNDARLVLALVDSFTGFGILPASSSPAAGPYTVIATDPPLTRGIALARLAGRTLSPAAAAFTEYLTTNWVALSTSCPEPAVTEMR